MNTGMKPFRNKQNFILFHLSTWQGLVQTDRSFNKWAKKNRNLRLSNVNKTALLYQCGPTTISIFTDATTLRNCL